MMDELLLFLLHRRAMRHQAIHPRIAVYAHDFIGLHVNVFGVYEKELLAACEPILSRYAENKLVLDVGANVGNHSLYFAKYAREVHAFEPNIATSSLLKINAKLFENIVVHEFGLSDRDGFAEAIVSRVNTGSASLGGRHDSDDTEGEVVKFKLREFDQIPEFHGANVGIVKIDVEGHESKVLAGMVGLLERQKPVVLFEQNLADAKSGTGEDLLAVLRSAGYDRLHVVNVQSSVLPRRLPRLIYWPLRVVERLIVRRSHRAELRSVASLEQQDYPLVIASCSSMHSFG